MVWRLNFGTVSLEEMGAVPVVVLGFCVACFAIWTLLARGGRLTSLRPIAGLSFFRSMTSRAAETGGRLHLALGRGALGTASTVETSVGLTALEYLSERAIIYDATLQVQISDPATLAAAQGVVERSRLETGHHRGRGDVRLEFISPEPLAYALGVTNSLEPSGADLTAALGVFGPEYLLMAETSAEKAIPQVGGTSIPETLALMHVSADESLIGEETFAVGAYLHRALHAGSLVAQDVLRVVLVFTIALGILLRGLGVGG